jgi:hypothetical protein
VPKKYNHTQCFEFFGVKPRNIFWSWSGRSDDGKDVAVTLWQDGFEDKGRIYRSWRTDRPGEWKSRPGFVELIENLALARNNAEGRVHVIVAKAKDEKAQPRSIERCFPQPNLKMRVVELNEAEGTFVLERIDA